MPHPTKLQNDKHSAKWSVWRSWTSSQTTICADTIFEIHLLSIEKRMFTLMV
jgi:hypothetical protein